MKKNSSKTIYRFPVIIEKDELGYFIGRFLLLKVVILKLKLFQNYINVLKKW